MAKVKICGITDAEDARLACEFGADALGFIFYERSPRFIEPEQAHRIINALPPFVSRVGVFVNVREARISELVVKLRLHYAQLHGDESPDFCGRLGFPYFKVFRVENGFDAEQLSDYDASAYLLDTYSDGSYGGTGRTFDWQIAKSAKMHGPIVLSGGLNPQNVFEAITFVRPYAVDVCSGVEAYPGKKDPDKMRAFFEQAFKANSASYADAK